MSSPTSRFSGASPKAQAKLNEIVDRSNTLQSLKGDGQFIRVIRTQFGTVISLVIDAIIARIPKVLGGGSVPAGVLFAVKVKKVGGSAGGVTEDCSFVYDIYPATIDWPGTGDPDPTLRLVASAPPETEVIAKTTYEWVPTGGLAWGWGSAFQLVEEGVLVTYLYHVTDERPLRHECTCE